VLRQGQTSGLEIDLACVIICAGRSDQGPIRANVIGFAKENQNPRGKLLMQAMS